MELKKRRRTEVVDEISLGHADTRVAQGEGVVGLVRDDLDLELRIAVEDRLVLQGHVANLVEGLGHEKRGRASKRRVASKMGNDNRK